MDKEERKVATRRKTGNEKRKRGEKSVTAACLEEEETDPRMEEIPENGANVAYRHINLANVLGEMTGRERIGKKNVLSLSTHVLM